MSANSEQIEVVMRRPTTMPKATAGKMDAESRQTSPRRYQRSKRRMGVVAVVAVASQLAYVLIVILL